MTTQDTESLLVPMSSDAISISDDIPSTSALSTEVNTLFDMEEDNLLEPMKEITNSPPALNSKSLTNKELEQEKDPPDGDDAISLEKTTAEETENKKLEIEKNVKEVAGVQEQEEEEEETRLISLDSIIRKSLTERLPMTAKDIDNIVPNAIKKQQELNEKNALQSRLKNVINTDDFSDDDDDDEEDEYYDDNDDVEEKNKVPDKIEDKNENVIADKAASAQETEQSEKDEEKSEYSSVEPLADECNEDDFIVEMPNVEVDDDKVDAENELLCDLIESENNEEEENVSDEKLPSEKPTDENIQSGKDERQILIQSCVSLENSKLTDKQKNDQSLLRPMTEIPFMNSNEEEDKHFVQTITNSTAEEKMEETAPSKPNENIETIDSETSSNTESHDNIEINETATINKSRRPSASNKTETRVLAQPAEVTPKPLFNKRGQPTKSYDETTTDDAFLERKSSSRKIKAPPYTGPKRKPGRPRRDDATPTTSYSFQPDNSSITTPMDELISMGHSLFSEYQPKKPGRPKRDNYPYGDNEYELSPVDITDDESPQLIAPIENLLSVQHDVSEPQASSPMVFKRKPGRPKIDKESGGHIVFQNSELTVVNKILKVHDERISTIQSGFEDSHEKFANSLQQDIEIVPIAGQRGCYNLPRETTITGFTNDKSIFKNVHDNPPYQDLSIASINPNSHTYQEMPPLDDMLEVHHVEDYEPDDFSVSETRKRGRKKEPHYRSVYSDHTDDKLKSNGPSIINVKRMEDLYDMSRADINFGQEGPSSTNNEQKSSAQTNRDKRLSGTQPTYIEWDESSNDASVPNADGSLPPLNKNKRMHWRTQRKLKKLNRKHWRTKLKEDQLKYDATNENSKIESEASKVVTTIAEQQTPLLLPNDEPLSNIQTISADSTTNIMANEKDQIASADHSSSVTNQQAVESSADSMNLMKRKRIPKLKYGSFNFSERRRDPNKPKMVLKYKAKNTKKYIRKMVQPTPPPPPTSTYMVRREDGSIANVSSDCLTPNQLLAGGAIQSMSVGAPIEKIRKKPGRKPRIALPTTTAVTTNITPIIQQHNNLVTDAAGGQSSLKRKYVRKLQVSIDPSILNNDDNSNTNDDIEVRSPFMVAGGGDADYEAIMKQRRLNNVYFENQNKVLQEQNKILLDMLNSHVTEAANSRLLTTNRSSVATVEKSTIFSAEIGGGSGDRQYTVAELSKSFCLQKLSKQFYEFVHNQFGLPLPTPAAIDNYVNGIPLIRGMLKRFLQILDCNSEFLKESDKVTILQISTIKIKTNYEYDAEMDCILGKHSTMTVVVAKGLYANWQQAVYINYDVTRFKEALNLIIEELYKIKYTVIACVCNYVDGKENLWNELGIGLGCNYFSHPITTEFIYAFYYIDDLLLTIRKYFINSGFVSDVGKINKDPIVRLQQMLINSKATTVRENLLNLSSLDEGALDIFSKDISTLLRLCLPQDSAATMCADFIDVIASFYQLMMSTMAPSENVKNPANIQYGSNLEYQNNILNDVQLNFYKLRCTGASKISEFQRATMMLIESLKMLQHSTKQKYKIDSFATHQITSEYLMKQYRQVVDSNTLLTPLKAFTLIKEIFLHVKPTTSVSNECLFYNKPIDVSKKEDYYVKLLIDWMCEKNKKNQTMGQQYVEFLKQIVKLEEIFQTIQNPDFLITEDVVEKVVKKIKPHTPGLFLDVVQTFVLQRHLLRIKYFNALYDAVKIEKTIDDGNRSFSIQKT